MKISIKNVFSFLLLSAIILFVIYYRESIFSMISNPISVKEYILSKKDMALPIFLFLNLIRGLFLLPAGALAVVSGITFGTIPGTFITCFGVTLSAILSYYISKIAGRDYVRKLFKGKLDNIESKLKNNGIFYIVTLRLLPIVPFDLVSYGAGLTDIRMRDFIFGTFIGSLPGAFTYSYLGTGVLDIHSKDFLYSIILVIVTSLIPLIYKYFFRKG